MAIVDLNQLAAPDVVEVLDYESILSERKATLVSLYPEEQQEAVARTLTLESEPIVKLLQENAYREVIWRQRVNEAARAVMLAYAAGSDLDQIGGNYNVERLVITPADDTTFPPTPAVMETTLARSGYNADDVLAATGSTVNLSLAADVDIAEAADIITNMQSAFNLPTTEIERVADVMTKGFTSSNTGLVELGEAMKYVAPIAEAAGAGRAWPLIDGTGMIHGMYVIDKVTHTHSELFSDGAARKIEFSLSLKRVDESLAAIYGDLKTQADNLVTSAGNWLGGLAG